MGSPRAGLVAPEVRGREMLHEELSQILVRAVGSAHPINPGMLLPGPGQEPSATRGQTQAHQHSTGVSSMLHPVPHPQTSRVTPLPPPWSPQHCHPPSAQPRRQAGAAAWLLWDFWDFPEFVITEKERKGLRGSAGNEKCFGNTGDHLAGHLHSVLCQADKGEQTPERRAQLDWEGLLPNSQLLRPPNPIREPAPLTAAGVGQIQHNCPGSKSSP